jgi:hypothetical protein
VRPRRLARNPRGLDPVTLACPFCQGAVTVSWEAATGAPAADIWHSWACRTQAEPVVADQLALDVTYALAPLLDLGDYVVTGELARIRHRVAIA